MSEKNSQLKKLVNSSGFPFQIAVESKVQEISMKTGWNIIVREHPWKNLEDENEGFIDLVVGKGAVRLVLECKRPRGGVWLFLFSHKRQESVQRFRIYWAQCMPERKDLFGWHDYNILPESTESEFCVIRGHGEDEETLLERLGRLVLSSTEALAEEEINLIRSSRIDKLRIMIPVIVTSAELRTCKLNLEDISVSNGTIVDSEFKLVPWVRFRKSLTFSNVDLSKFTELHEVTEEKERSIFIINSLYLSEFLEKWEIKAPLFGGHPWDFARLIEEKNANNG